MKYIITENKMGEVLNTLIRDRYKGIKFNNARFGIIGILPHKKDINLDDTNWSMVYEREDEPGSKRMVLWIYEKDFDYFLAMVPLSGEQIKNAVKHWFENKMKLKVDLVNIQ